MSILGDARNRLKQSGYSFPSSDPYGHYNRRRGITKLRVPGLSEATPVCPPGYHWDAEKNACVNDAMPEVTTPAVNQDEVDAAREPRLDDVLGGPTPGVLRIGDEDYRISNTAYGEDQLSDDGRMGHGGSYVVGPDGRPIIDAADTSAGEMTDDGLVIGNIHDAAFGQDPLIADKIARGILAVLPGGNIIAASTGLDERTKTIEGDRGIIQGAFTNAADDPNTIRTGIIRSGGVDANRDGVINAEDDVFVSPREAQSGIHTERIEGNPEMGYSYGGLHYDTFAEAKAAKDKGVTHLTPRGGYRSSESNFQMDVAKLVGVIGSTIGEVVSKVQDIARQTGRNVADVAADMSNQGPAAPVATPGTGGGGPQTPPGGTAPGDTGPRDEHGNKVGQHHEPGRGPVNYGGGDTGYERSEKGREGSGEGGKAKSGESVSNDHDWSDPNRNQGGLVYRNIGGATMETHPGEPRGTDDVPAWLTEGEFIIDRDSTEKFRPVLEAINEWEPGDDASDILNKIESDLDDLINSYAFGGKVK